jgi:hypothetical protein
VALAVLDINRASMLAGASMSDEDYSVFEAMRRRIRDSDPEMSVFRNLADRYDNLYYPQGFTEGGASHWAYHKSANTPGRSHVSVNSYPAYIDIPASLTSVPPVENFVASSEDSEEAGQQRDVANMAERIYTAWKDTEEIEYKGHQACVVKALYGRTAAKVYWDDEEDRPCVAIVEQPRNLRLGWSSSDHTKLSWACYTYLISPDTAAEEYGIRIEVGRDAVTGAMYPYVAAWGDVESSAFTTPGELALEVYDYWYRQPVRGAKFELGKKVKFETWNALFIGNALIQRKKHPEYGGMLPYVVLCNTFIPGATTGRPELYDIEQLVREKDERFSETAQMMSRAINGQYWQLVGPEAPELVPQGLRPIPNQVVGPGGGNRIEAITPWMPTFQVEQHFTRLDRELSDVSGLNDLLRGLAPPAVLSSGKAINALVANYEARIRIKRDIYYRWRRELRALAFAVWGYKNRDIRDIITAPFRHDIQPPTLTPRDDMETATMAANLAGAKLWSSARAMDRVGVDDPEMEQDIIREEQTDATLNPAAVMTMAQMLTVLKQLGIPAPPAAEAAAAEQQQALASSRLLGGGAAGQPALNAEGEQPMLPPEAGPPPETGVPLGAEPGTPPPAPAGGIEGQMLTQQMTPTGGEPKTRIMSQQKIIG